MKEKREKKKEKTGGKIEKEGDGKEGKKKREKRKIRKAKIDICGRDLYVFRNSYSW